MTKFNFFVFFLRSPRSPPTHASDTRSPSGNTLAGPTREGESGMFLGLAALLLAVSGAAPASAVEIFASSTSCVPNASRVHYSCPIAMC